MATATDRQKTTKEGFPVPDSGERKVSLLVVEDDENISTAISEYFSRAGYNVKTVEDGLNGVKAALDDPPDAVVLDLMLPKMDGLAAAKEILKLNPDQRIIFASAYVKETLRDSVRELEKVVELIQKPFEPKVLVELIENTATIKELEEINKMVTDMNGSKSDDAQINELLAILKRVQKVGF